MIKVPATSTGITIILIIAIAVIIGGPLAFIWALNTLFPVLNIPFTLETWFAAFIIPAAFKTQISTNNKD